MGNITHMNSTEHALTAWSPNDIHLVLKDLASFHAQFLGQEDKLLNMSFLENMTRSMMKVLKPAYEAMVKTNRKNEPELFTEFVSQTMLDYLDHSDEYWTVLERSPRTLVSISEKALAVLMSITLTVSSCRLLTYITLPCIDRLLDPW